MILTCAFLANPAALNAKGETIPIKDQVMAQAVQKFGKGSKFVDWATRKGTSIRYLKAIGYKVTKTKGEWSVYNPTSRISYRLLWATIQPSIDHIVSQYTKRPVAAPVDLTELGEELPEASP